MTETSFRTRPLPFCLLVMTAALLAGADVRGQVVRLPALGNVAIDQTSVSGLSSGGYMAVQFHVANSAIVKGAGVIAGGPYFCAKDDQTAATTVCSCAGLTCHPEQASQLVPSLIQKTDQYAQQGAVDPTVKLAGSRVWLFGGTLDSTVPPAVMNALESYYASYLPVANIAFIENIPAEHAMPTDSFGNACQVRGDPFINNCGFDAAGALLQWIYGSLNPRSTGALGGQLIEFDQGEFLAAPTSHGMSQTGWVYVPASCQQNAPCRVHVAFHGCKQYPGYPYPQGPQGKFGDTFAKNAGYLRWADTNGFVVLFPQANAMTTGTRLPRINPVGCWDWWGYDDAAYATRNGRQMAAVRKMVDRLAGQGTGTPEQPGFCGTASNSEHVSAQRATRMFLLYFARGTKDFLGFGGGTRTTLKQTGPDTYQQVAACS